MERFADSDSDPSGAKEQGVRRKNVARATDSNRNNRTSGFHGGAKRA